MLTFSTAVRSRRFLTEIRDQEIGQIAEREIALRLAAEIGHQGIKREPAPVAALQRLGENDRVDRGETKVGEETRLSADAVRDLDPDVYSLGCTAFFCLAARPPFKGEDPDAAVRPHREAPRPSVQAQARSPCRAV